MSEDKEGIDWAGDIPPVYYVHRVHRGECGKARALVEGVIVLHKLVVRVGREQLGRVEDQFSDERVLDDGLVTLLELALSAIIEDAPLGPEVSE